MYLGCKDTKGGHCQGACCPQWFFMSHSMSERRHCHLCGLASHKRYTVSSVEGWQNEPPQASPKTGLESGPPAWQTRMLPLHCSVPFKYRYSKYLLPWQVDQAAGTARCTVACVCIPAVAWPVTAAAAESCSKMLHCLRLAAPHYRTDAPRTSTLKAVTYLYRQRFTTATTFWCYQTDSTRYYERAKEAQEGWVDLSGSAAATKRSKLTVTQLWYGWVVLELVERPL